MTSVFAPHPSASSPQLKECLPLIILLRNRLKYALTDEVTTICVQQFIKIDGKVWTDITYPASFMDAIRVDKTAENFHLIYDTKSYFVVHHITPEKAKYKLCKVRKSVVGTKGVPIWWLIHYSDWFWDWKKDQFHQVWHWEPVSGDWRCQPGKNLYDHRRRDILISGCVSWERCRCPPTFSLLVNECNKSRISFPQGKYIRLTIIKERDKSEWNDWKVLCF